MLLGSLRGAALQWAITISTTSCFLLFGYDQGVIGGLLTQKDFLNIIGNPKPVYLGQIVALYNIGCLFGCMTAATFGDKLGRKRTIFWACTIMVVGGAIQAATFSAPQLIVGRLISGLGNGMNTSTIPIYISETAKAKDRARMISIQLTIVIFGIMLAYWVDYGSIRGLSGSATWRFPIALQNAFALITMATLPFLPETPRWLYAHGRKPEAIVVLSRLFDTTQDDPEVNFVRDEMETAVRMEHEQPQMTLKIMLNDKSDIKYGRRVLLCFTVQAFQQLTGINAVVFYITIVLEQNVGLAPDTASLVAGFIELAFVVGCIPPIFYLDKIGRRKVLIAGSIGLVIIVSIFTAAIANPGHKATANLALAMLIAYQFWFAFTWNTIPWIYPPEITPLRIRHIGSAAGPFAEWLFTYIIVSILPVAIANTGWKIYLLFIFAMSASVPVIFYAFPETQGKTLEEIDYIFVKGDARANMSHADFSNEYGNGKRDEMELKPAAIHVDNASGSS